MESAGKWVPVHEFTTEMVSITSSASQLQYPYAITFQHVFRGPVAQANWCSFALMEPYNYTHQIYKLINLEHKVQKNDRILFWKELLSYTVEGRRVEMITMTSKSGVHPNTKRMPKIPGTAESGWYQRPYVLERPVVFLTARAHASDVPASRTMDAILEFLTNDGDSQAYQLLSEYTFVLVPMLNPDGVVRGNHTMDALGLDLNR